MPHEEDGARGSAPQPESLTVHTININSIRQNRTVHTCRVDADALVKLAREAVAKQLGLDIESAHLTVRASTSTYQEGSLATSKPCVQVEIIEHHGSEPEGAPRAA